MQVTPLKEALNAPISLVKHPLLKESFRVEFVELGEIFNIKNGYTPSKSRPEFWQGGTIPWFRMDDIRTNGRILSDSIQHITPQAVKRGLFKAGSLILSTTATIGEHALINVDFVANQRFTIFTLKDTFKDTLLMKFAFYYFFIIKEWCLKNVNVSSFAAVDTQRLQRYALLLPPLPIQEKIVTILDQLQALIFDLEQGIPAEIKARKKQFNYYLNHLLDFKGQA
ncbi:restriction endonuclease subunit S [Helicobacter suis]|uniref:restriction endonuclease subunit S n=1 Tax=Helicobacter suis TaxID=104628 RepID=UPI001F078AA6|nr:restriction endonuclease subunit S [Helicobacter suis]